MLPLLGLAAGMLGGGGGLGLSSSSSSSAQTGPVAIGPVVVNVAGFGSKASGKASAAATQSGFPASSGATAYSNEMGLPEMPGWLLPAGLALVVVIAFSLSRKG